MAGCGALAPATSWAKATMMRVGGAWLLCLHLLTHMPCPGLSALGARPVAC